MKIGSTLREESSIERPNLRIWRDNSGMIILGFGVTYFRIQF